nr:sulfotransferase 16 [Tanacetum cinerariifolium]
MAIPPRPRPTYQNVTNPNVTNLNVTNPNIINTVNDPLYIASSDHPGMVLTNIPFNGSNFHGWSKNVKMDLKAKLKLGFINDSCTKPRVDDVDNLNGFPAYDCGKMRECTCGVIEKFIERDSNSKLIQFLMKLSDGYESVRSQILAMGPLPSVNKAYYIMQQIEKHKQVTNHVFEPTAFFANMNNKGEILVEGMLRIVRMIQGKKSTRMDAHVNFGFDEHFHGDTPFDMGSENKDPSTKEIIAVGKGSRCLYICKPTTYQVTFSNSDSEFSNSD